jgi:putative membrane protein insertion efficiency factor
MQQIVEILIGLPAAVLIGGVRLYQWLISPWLGPMCRYQPSCSQYFVDAVRKYGAVRGASKGILRICRCHPLGGSGHDPP